MNLFDTSLTQTIKLIFNTNYQTKLAVVEVRINNLEEPLLSKLNMLEKQHYFINTKMTRVFQVGKRMNLIK